MSARLTDEEVEQEIERLNRSEAVRIARARSETLKEKEKS